MNSITIGSVTINWQTIQPYLLEYGLKFLVAVAIFVVGRWISKFFAALIRRSMTSLKLDPMISSFIGNISYTLLLAFVIIAALSYIGINTTSLAAILAAAGLAVGLSLQNSLSNLASGVMILAFRPFSIGDVVEISGKIGKVNAISMLTTILTTGDNKTIIIPNGKLTSDMLINYSKENNRRVDMVFSISYDDDLKKAKKLLTKIVHDHTLVLDTPTPVIAVSELADSSVNFIVRPWVRSGDYWNVFWDITEEVKLAFDKAGIVIPYPQRDVHLQEVKAS